jgi:microcystin-dependent protein
MSEPFLAEIKIMSFNFAPKGWAMCNGQLLPINQNQALFSLLGTTYGGNGQTTFALPDLRSRVPVYVGNGLILGERAGEEAHTLIVSEMAAHNHFVNAVSPTANAPAIPNDVLATADGAVYAPATSGLVAMDPSTIGATGGSQPHTNIQPYLTLNFCIALQGIFPSRN